MKAIILAAGMARRFGEFLGGMPKCHLKVSGLSLLEHQVKVLRSCGIDEFVAVRGYRAETIVISGARYYHNPEYEITNMVYSLFCAKEELRGDVLIAYADLLYDSDCITRVLHAAPAEIGVAVDMNWETYYAARYSEPLSEAESLVFGVDQTIINLGEPCPLRERVQAQYLGLIRLNGEGCETFKNHYARFAAKFRNREWIRGRRFEKAHMTDFLQALIDEGVRIKALPVYGGWLEFDSPSDFNKVQAWESDGSLGRFCRLS